ncbi:uncharacterized protein LOC129768279 [Toxorhynchites rutilus septentrionalis]|uniref:uncharacterized protein LOC129768279 n=1 Tax=Toxorhynchites rutilus septentrionalis TaxID=329112 RepID=UPI00247AE7B1|nr:uncharacterized protein LOC129768279 [Toxorhynchites rutilus septentrionalis]
MSELHRAVREIITEKRPHVAVVDLIANNALHCGAQNSDGLTPVELAVLLEPEGTLAGTMLEAECVSLSPVEAFKRILVRGNLFVVQILMRQMERKLGNEAAIDELRMAFAELQSRNVDLSTDIVKWAQYLLVESAYQRPICDKMGPEEKQDRLRHLIECIELVENSYDKDDFSDMDGRFVLFTRQIFEHVFFLKNAIKELPLMQLQFCLAIFLRGITGEADENCDIFNFIVDKEIIIGFLKTTKIALKNLDSVGKLSPQMYFKCIHMSEREPSHSRINKQTFVSMRKALTDDPELQTIAQIGHFDLLNPSQIDTLEKHCTKLQSDQRSFLHRKRFKRLLKTYYTAKQFYSVRKIIASIETVADLNLEDRAFLLTSVGALKRSLQIIGEAVKSSKQTPNITKKLDSIMHIFSAQSFVEITKDLRQFFSHGYSLAKRRLDQDCPLELFRSILNNLKQSGPWITYVLFLENVHVLRLYLGRLYRLSSVERMRSYVKFIGMEFKARLQSRYEPQDVNEAILLVDYLIKECNDPQEGLKLRQISRLLTMHSNALKSDVASIGQLIDQFFFLELYIRQSVTRVEHVRTIVEYMLRISRRVRRYTSADKSMIIMAPNLILQLRLSETNEKRKILLDEIWQRLVKQNVSAIESLKHQTVVGNDHCREETFKLLSQLGIAIDNMDFVGMVDRRLTNRYYQNLFDLNNKYHVLNEVIKDRRAGGQLRDLKEKLKKMRKSDEAYFQNQFEYIIDSIRGIVSKYGYPENKLSLQLSATDRYALEYYLLEIGEILCSLGAFQDNLQTLKLAVPMITGRNLRNYLAHDRLTYDILTESSSVIEMNALYILENPFKLFRKHTTFQSNREHGFHDLFRNKLAWINAQQELFKAIGAFDVSQIAQIVASCPVSLLGRDTLNKDVISIALNNNPTMFINHLLNQPEIDRNYFTIFLAHSTNHRLKQQINHLLTQPHQFCYATAIRFELVDQMIELRSHPEVNANLHNKETEQILSRYAVSSIRRLMNTLPTEQLLRDNRLQNTILHWAVLRGDGDLVRDALSRHRTLIDEPNVFKETPLALAVRYGYTDIVQLLLETGASVTSGVYSPLWISTTLGNSVLIGWLLNEATVVNMDSDSLLNAALGANNLELFKTLHEKYNLELLSSYSLHRAIQQGRKQFIYYILQSSQASTLINSLDYLSFTPLMTAAACGRLDIAMTLLQHGANPSFVNDYGYTALHSAVHSGNRQIVEALLAQPGNNLNALADDNVSAISLAISQNDTRMIQFLLTKGARIMTHQLIHAAYFNHYHMVRTLLDRDSSLLNEAVDVAGRSLLVYAVIDVNLPMVEYLLAKDIDVNKRTHGDLTALHIAASKNQPELCDRLIQAGCDRDAVDDEGRTALVIALLQEFLTVANLLIERGVNSDCVRGFRFRGSRNATLLHKFAHENRVFMVRLLLDHPYRLDPRAADDNGDTALDYARERANDQIVAMLKSHPLAT